MHDPADMHDAAALYMAQVEAVSAADPVLSPLGAGILAALALDIAGDSRGFARTFGLEHALVLREIQHLVELDRLVVIRRDARTQRCVYAAAPVGTARQRAA